MLSDLGGLGRGLPSFRSLRFPFGACGSRRFDRGAGERVLTVGLGSVSDYLDWRGVSFQSAREVLGQKHVAPDPSQFEQGVEFRVAAPAHVEIEPSSGAAAGSRTGSAGISGSG